MAPKLAEEIAKLRKEVEQVGEILLFYYSIMIITLLYSVSLYISIIILFSTMELSGNLSLSMENSPTNNTKKHVLRFG